MIVIYGRPVIERSGDLNPSGSIHVSDYAARDPGHGGIVPELTAHVDVPLDAATNVGARILQRMGFTGHGGLGKRGTGTREPVRMAFQQTTAGLGARGGGGGSGGGGKNMKQATKIWMKIHPLKRKRPAAR